MLFRSVPGGTDDAAHLDRLADLLLSFGPAVERVDVLPYHRMGAHKWAELGRPYALADVEPPSSDMLAAAVARLRAHGLPAV